MLLFALVTGCAAPHVPDLTGRWEGQFDNCNGVYYYTHTVEMTLGAADGEDAAQHSGSLLLYGRETADEDTSEWGVEFAVMLESGGRARREIPQHAEFVDGYCQAGQEHEYPEDCMDWLFSGRVLSGDVVTFGQWRWDWEHEWIDVAWHQPGNRNCAGTLRADDG